MLRRAVRNRGPTSGRISFGAKSPLTGGIKEANSGGNPGQDLMKLGYRAIIVKGQPADPENATDSRSRPAAPRSSPRMTTKACGTTPALREAACETTQDGLGHLHWPRR